MILQKVELRLVARVAIQGDPEELDETSIAADLQGCLEVGLEGAPEAIAPEVEYVEVTRHYKREDLTPDQLHHYNRALEGLQFLEELGGPDWMTYPSILRAIAAECLDRANICEANHG